MFSSKKQSRSFSTEAHSSQIFTWVFNPKRSGWKLRSYSKLSISCMFFYFTSFFQKIFNKPEAFDEI